MYIVFPFETASKETVPEFMVPLRHVTVALSARVWPTVTGFAEAVSVVVVGIVISVSTTGMEVDAA